MLIPRTGRCALCLEVLVQAEVQDINQVSVQILDIQSQGGEKGGGPGRSEADEGGINLSHGGQG